LITGNPVAQRFVPVTRLAAILCGWWLLAFSALTAIEIFGRKFFGFSLQGIDEIGGYSLAVVTAFGFSYALLNRSHTRMDGLLNRLPGLARSLLNIVAALTIAATAVFATWRGYAELNDSLEFMSVANSPLQTPLWIPQGLWVLGLMLFAIVSVALALHAVWLGLTDRRRLNRFYGPLTLQEEIETELGTDPQKPERRS
jgi:TRAP-type C4-dicarboxylate transport system permease small subunit